MGQNFFYSAATFRACAHSLARQVDGPQPFKFLNGHDITFAARWSRRRVRPGNLTPGEALLIHGRKFREQKRRLVYCLKRPLSREQDVAGQPVSVRAIRLLHAGMLLSSARRFLGQLSEVLPKGKPDTCTTHIVRNIGDVTVKQGRRVLNRPSLLSRVASSMRGTLIKTTRRSSLVPSPIC